MNRAVEPARETLTALVLAAGRRGDQDPVAQLQGKSLKCLVEVDGVAMIERVVVALLDSGCCHKVLISIESGNTLRELERMSRWLDEGIVSVVPSAGNLGDSILNLAEGAEPLLPLLITTADNVLHTPELIRSFVAGAQADDRDVSVGVTREKTVRVNFPDEQLGFFQFRDGGYSFCNLYVIHTRKGFDLTRVFHSGGQFRKHPWRILTAFGVLTLLLYKFRVITIDGCFRRLSRKFRVTARTVDVPWSYSAIDVDNPRTYELSEKILRQRREG